MIHNVEVPCDVSAFLKFFRDRLVPWKIVRGEDEFLVLVDCGNGG